MNIYKSFSVYLGASLIQRGIAFFILPIFTFYLGPGDFGMLSLLTTLFVFTSPVIALGTTSAISVAFFNENQADYASYVSSSLLVPLVISSSITLLSILFGQYFSVLLGVPQIWLSLIPIFSFMSVIIMTMLIDYQVKKESIKYGVFSISNSVLNTVLSLLLVIGLGMNYQGRLIGQYFSIFLFTIIALILLYRRGLLTSKISLRFIKDNIFAYKMEREHSIDIDNRVDLFLAEAMLRSMN